MAESSVNCSSAECPTQCISTDVVRLSSASASACGASSEGLRTCSAPSPSPAAMRTLPTLLRRLL
eukprot:2128597-Alexandrium_andersonii.AAC.1